MTVELIPVIEVSNFDQDIKIPEGPYWEHSDDWEIFNQASSKKAGFPDNWKSYLRGSSFYRISEISDNNLKKLIKDETEEMRKENDDRDLVSSFSGGYVLNVDNQDLLYPQCCSDLKTIYEWEDLVKNSESIFYNGHPAPLVTTKNENVIFNLSLGEKYYEKFVPTPIKTLFSVDKEHLRIAIEKVKIELCAFSERLKKVADEEKLDIHNIDKLLVWGDD